MLVDARWLLVLPLALVLAFAFWVIWNLSKEINARKRRWVVTYRESPEQLRREGVGENPYEPRPRNRKIS